MKWNKIKSGIMIGTLAGVCGGGIMLFAETLWALLTNPGVDHLAIVPVYNDDAKE